MRDIFVSYCGNNIQGKFQISNILYQRESAIKTIDDIRDIQYSIEQLFGFPRDTCRIISWRRMEE